MLEARTFERIGQLGREAWDVCAPGALEGFDYLTAVERAELPGFSWRYVLIEEDGRPLAVAPVFLTDYRLDTTLTAFGRAAVAASRRVLPRAFTVRMACLGSPCTEDAGLAIAQAVQSEQRPAVVASALSALDRLAAEAGCGLVAVKDAPAGQAGAWATAARDAGFHPTPGMPSAELGIAFADLEGYLATLGAGTRKDMRRKLKAMAELRIETTCHLGGLEARVLELYRQTRARSDLQFEDLTLAYFTGVLRAMGERAFAVLYWADDELIGFNLLLQDGSTLLDKFFCMASDRGPAFNLYFVSWFVNVRLCLERGLTRYQSGQAAYGDKLRLGSRLIGAQTWFRHRQPVVNRALGWLAPLLADEPVRERKTA